ncbi:MULTISPECIES: DUF3592 domain-containing protein [unclassified Streptomyces]|uniref:DUF3592 domain-containing protein n=1 Tax=unclassified Streptomyces TaxID=2593676 RepID=UPI0038112564
MLEYLFPAIPVLMALGGIGGILWAVVRQRRLNSAWRSGIAVQGRCLRTYMTTVTRTRNGMPMSASSYLTHVYEFTTPEGQTMRFEERGPATIFQGEAVTIRYPRNRPDRATALPPGDRRARAVMWAKVGFGSFFTVLSLTVAVIFHAVASGVSDVEDKVTHDRERPAPTAPSFPTLPDGWPSGMPRPTGFPELPKDMP